MARFPSQLNNLIEDFAKLPGIGRKTAERFVFYLIKQPKSEITSFIQSLTELQNNTHTCSQCHNLTEQEGLCPICRNSSRDQKQICVVEEIHDLNVLEETNEYHGVYHVLGGTINPIDGVTEQHLNVRKLIERIQQNNITEVILALNPDMQGEATMLYLKKLLLPTNVKITRLAKGLPMGSDIEYADEVTLANAIKGRREA